MPVLFDTRVNTLKSYITQAPQFNTSKIEDTIELGGAIPLGPCSYSKKFSEEKHVPLCGSDFLIEDE